MQSKIFLAGDDRVDKLPTYVGQHHNLSIQSPPIFQSVLEFMKTAVNKNIFILTLPGYKQIYSNKKSFKYCDDACF